MGNSGKKKPHWLPRSVGTHLYCATGLLDRVLSLYMLGRHAISGQFRALYGNVVFLSEDCRQYLYSTHDRPRRSAAQLAARTVTQATGLPGYMKGQVQIEKKGKK